MIFTINCKKPFCKPNGLIGESFPKIAFPYDNPRIQNKPEFIKRILSNNGVTMVIIISTSSVEVDFPNGRLEDWYIVKKKIKEILERQSVTFLSGIITP